MDEQRVDSPAAPATDVVALDGSAEPAAVRDAFRARHRLSASVMERPQQFTATYSLRDLHRLTFLSHEERAAILIEWHAWHRKYVRLGRMGAALWVGGAFSAWALWFKSDPLANAFQSATGIAISGGWFTGLTIAVVLGLLMTLSGFLATLFAPALSDSYLRGYTDGLTRGVNRALHITPETEQQMWEELRRAERLDASWRKTSQPETKD